MQTGTEAKLEKIKTISSLLWQGCGLLLAFMPFIIIGENLIILLGHDPTFSFLNSTFPLYGSPFRNRVALSVMIDLWMGVGVKRLYHLFQLFSNYSCGEVFASGSARQIRKIGITSLMFSALVILWVSLPPGLLAHPAHAIQTSILSALDGAFVIAISTIMEMAAEMREENELTV